MVCETEEDVRLLHCLLSSTPVWKVTGNLHFYAATEESWALLGELMPRGRIGKVWVTEEAIAGAREEDVRAVWAATEKVWLNYSTRSTIAKHSDGQDGLHAVMKFRQAQLPVSQTSAFCCNLM